MTAHRFELSWPVRGTVLRLLLALSLALALATPALLLAPGTACAQSSQHTVFWHVGHDADVDAVARERFDTELKRVLSRAQQIHLVTRTALVNQLRKQPMQIPPCFEGAAPCTSTPEQLAQALAVDGIVRGRLSRADGDDAYTLQLDYFREFGGGSKSVEKTGRIDDIVAAAVAGLFTLEASITIASQPPGAVLYVNGKLIGETPVAFSAGEGMHSVRLTYEGYEDLREEIAVTPGAELALDFALRPRLTQLTVLTRAPEAQVWIDGTFLGMAGDAIDVAPGPHTVELRAPGYRPLDISVEMQAAQRRTLSLAMLREVEDPWSRRERAITRYPLYLEAGYDLFFQSGSFADASGEPEGERLLIRGFDGQDETSLLFNGASLAAGWTHDHFGLSLIGVQLGVANLDATVRVEAEDGLTRRDARANSVFHVGVYPLQPTARMLFGAFGIDARTGLGMAFDRFDLELDGDSIALSEINGFWNLNVAGRYYWAEDWYASLGYGLEVDFTDTRSPRHGLQLRIGFSLPLLVDGGSEAAGTPVPVEQLPLDDAHDAAPPPDIPQSLPPLRDAPPAEPLDAPETQP